MLRSKSVPQLFLALLSLFAFVACDGNEDESLPEVDEEWETILNPNAQPIIAHRGCWSGDSLPQNSLAAFRRALHMPILGTEFDVRQTLDGQLVVCHRAEFDSLEISKTPYQELCRHRLSNGETIPLVEDFIRTYLRENSKVLMVADLKDCDVNVVIDLFKKYDVLQHVLFISFYKKYCNLLVNRGFGRISYYMSGNLTPQEVLDAGYGGVDYSHAVYENHPEWISETHELGLNIGVWVVNKEELAKQYFFDSVIVTTDKVSSFLSLFESISSLDELAILRVEHIEE